MNCTHSEDQGASMCALFLGLPGTWCGRSNDLLDAEVPEGVLGG